MRRKGTKEMKEKTETKSARKDSVVNCRVDNGKDSAFVSSRPSNGLIGAPIERLVARAKPHGSKQ